MALFDSRRPGLRPASLRLPGRGEREMETDFTLGLGDPAQAGESPRHPGHGFRTIKVKLGSGHQDD